MLDIGWSEIIVVGGIALIVVGPKELPQLMRTVGKYVNKARGVARDFQRSMEDVAQDADIANLKELRDAANDIKDSAKIDQKLSFDQIVGKAPKPGEEGYEDKADTGSGTSDEAVTTKPASKKTASKKPASKKPAAKKAPPKKVVAKKTGDTAAKTAPAKKAASSKTSTGKTAAKKSTAKKETDAKPAKRPPAPKPATTRIAPKPGSKPAVIRTPPSSDKLADKSGAKNSDKT